MTRIGMIGASGRMGRAILSDIATRDGISGEGIGRDGDPLALARGSDVLIDFSAPDGLAANTYAAAEAGVPILVGTTGLSAEHQALLDAAGAQVALIQAANTSLGVNLLAHLVREAAARLGTDWDIEIVEMHHRHKVDAPSGTALLLGSAAADGRRGELADLACTDRNGARDAGTIGFASLRGGSVAGDHQVVFAGEGERIELGHRTESRAIFAAGAVRAALWLIGKPAGRYTMADVLGIS